MRNGLVFSTLGPAGSNHDLVTRRYLAFHGLNAAHVRLEADFESAIALLAGSEVNHVVQVAVHPSTVATVATAFFQHGIRVVDAFVSPSHPLAILTRAEIAIPRSIALQPATASYADLSAWVEHALAPTTIAAAEMLLTEQVDSALTQRSFLERHPHWLRLEQEIPSVDDAWLVYGREQVSASTPDGLIAWRDSPAGRLYRGEAG